MPTTRLSLEVGSFAFDVADDGALLEFRHTAAVRPVLTRITLGPIVSRGAARRWHDHAVRVDEDETELTCRAGPVQAELRQSFAAGWTTRLALTNTGDEPYELDDLVIELQPGEGVTPWLICGGTEGWFAFLPATGPILAGRSTNGWIDDLDAVGLHLGPAVLGRGERHIVRLPWDWHPDPAALRSRLPDWLPARSTVRAGDFIGLRTGPDTALSFGTGVDESDPGHSAITVLEEVADAGVVLLAADPGTGQITTGPGRSGRVELRSARGTAVVQLGWAPGLDDVLAEAVLEVLDRPRNRSGLAPLAGLDDALLLQRAIAAGSMRGQDEISDALDLWTARCLDPDVSPVNDPWRCTYAVGEAQRLDDPDFLAIGAIELQAVIRQARRGQRIPAGLGTAVVRLSVASMLAGGDFAAPLADVQALLSDTGIVRDAGWWEARLATERPTHRHEGPGHGDATLELLAVGRRLGAGLAGQAGVPLAAAARAQQLALLRLAPESMGARLTRDWGIDPAGLAQQAEAELLLQLYRSPVGPAHRWLAVAEPPA